MSNYWRQKNRAYAQWSGTAYVPPDTAWMRLRRRLNASLTPWFTISATERAFISLHIIALIVGASAAVIAFHLWSTSPQLDPSREGVGAFERWHQ